MVKMQPYIIVKCKDKLFMCCMKCGKMRMTLAVCDHKPGTGDYFLDVDRRKIKLRSEK